MCNRGPSMSIGIEVNLILVRNHETLWKSNVTHCPSKWAQYTPDEVFAWKH